VPESLRRAACRSTTRGSPRAASPAVARWRPAAPAGNRQGRRGRLYEVGSWQSMRRPPGILAWPPGEAGDSWQAVRPLHARRCHHARRRRRREPHAADHAEHYTGEGRQVAAQALKHDSSLRREMEMQSRPGRDPFLIAPGYWRLAVSQTLTANRQADPARGIRSQTTRQSAPGAQAGSPGRSARRSPRARANCTVLDELGDGANAHWPRRLYGWPRPMARSIGFSAECEVWGHTRSDSDALPSRGSLARKKKRPVSAGSLPGRTRDPFVGWLNRRGC